MCGIAGVVRARGREVAQEAMDAMASALGHRGPDRSATFIDGSVGLAQTRLSIQDPGPGGDQPFVDERHALVYNGELYNTRELRAELVAAGVDFRGHSDTEVLFHLIARHGIDHALARIDGMYAF